MAHRMGWGCWLLVRRNRSTGELAFYRCAAPAAMPLTALVRVAGCRWRIEESFQATKGLCGLDEHQVRCWRSWYWCCNEIAHLFAVVVLRPAADHRHRLRWSWWRRRHQARARACHYRRQAAQPP
jgi:SRSO17 transposase